MVNKKVQSTELESFFSLNFGYTRAYKTFKSLFPKRSFIRKNTYEGLKNEFIGKPLRATQAVNVAIKKAARRRVYPPKVYCFRDKLGKYYGLNLYFVCTPQFKRYHVHDFEAIRDLYIDWIQFGNLSRIGVTEEPDREYFKAPLSVADIDGTGLPGYLLTATVPRLHDFEFSNIDVSSADAINADFIYRGLWIDGEWKILIAPDDFPEDEISELCTEVFIR
jgi:hypothetical protein